MSQKYFLSVIYDGNFSQFGGRTQTTFSKFAKFFDLNMNSGLCANHVSFANLTNKPLPGTTIKTTVLTAQGKQIVLYYILPLAKSR